MARSSYLYIGNIKTESLYWMALAVICIIIIQHVVNVPFECQSINAYLCWPKKCLFYLMKCVCCGISNHQSTWFQTNYTHCADPFLLLILLWPSIADLLLLFIISCPCVVGVWHRLSFSLLSLGYFIRVYISHDWLFYVHSYSLFDYFRHQVSPDYVLRWTSVKWRSLLWSWSIGINWREIVVYEKVSCLPAFLCRSV